MGTPKPILEALKLLDDPNVAETSRIWFRRGGRGNIHGARGCWKARDAQSVTLSIAEAAAKKTCDYCFLDGIQYGSPVRNAIELHAIAVRVAWADEHLTDGTARGSSRALDLARTSAQELEKLDSPDGCAKAHGKLSEKARAIAEMAERKLSTCTDAVLKDAATQLEVVDYGREPKEARGYGRSFGAAVPYAAAGDVERAGVHRSSGSALVRAYRLWQERRVNDAEPEAAATAAEDLLLETATLTELRQLHGVPLAADHATDALEAAAEAWRNNLRETIRGLTAAWEAQYRENVTQTELVTLGVRHYNISSSDNAVLGALRAYPHVETRTVIVGTYPQVVAWWIVGILQHYPQLADCALTRDDLHAASVLWDPTNGSSAYQTMESAARAAQAL